MQFNINTITKIKAQGWNQYLFNNNGTFLQSYDWALLALQTEKLTPFFLELFDNDKKVLQLLFFKGSISYRNQANSSFFSLKRIISSPLNFINWFSGPVLLSNINNKNAYLQEVINYFIKNFKKYKVLGLYNCDFPYHYEPENNNLQIDFKSTNIIDTQQNFQIISKKILKKKSTKYLISKALKQNLRFCELSNENQLDYYHLIQESIESGRLQFISKQNFLQTYNFILQNKLGMIFGVFDTNNELLSALILTIFNNKAIQIYTVNSNKIFVNKIPSAYFLTFKTIEYCCINNLDYFDLAGIPFDPQTASKDQLDLYIYKKKWGGTKIDYKSLTFDPYSIIKFINYIKKYKK